MIMWGRDRTALKDGAIQDARYTEGEGTSPVQQNVIPAKAGIHAVYPNARSWIPAFAGMTI
jgi:hypothetical protein